MKKFAIYGTTTLSGKIIDVDRMKNKVKIHFLNGAILSCEISDSDMAKIESCLYGDVIFSGEASWHFKTAEMLTFKIRSFKKTKSSMAPEIFLENLRERFGVYFNGIQDVDQYVKELRSSLWSE